MKNYIPKTFISSQKSIILLFLIFCLSSFSSYSQEFNNIQMAVESIKEGISAGKIRNSMIMLDTLKTGHEYLLNEQEINPNKNIKEALRHLQSAISYAIGGRHNHSIAEAEKALVILQ